MTTPSTRARGVISRQHAADQRRLRLVKPGADQSSPPPRLAREELERLLASGDFDGTPRSRAFLRFIVEEAVGGRGDGLTQAALAMRVFGRRSDFDPTIDPIVRIQAGRLRRSLERYYLLKGTRSAVRIELPRGGYVPVVKWAASREPAAAGEAASERRGDDWPCVVVGPFWAVGSPAAGEETALRFCERLALEIGRHGLRVALRKELDELGAAEAGRFALSGQLSFAGARWTTMARLVDGRSARQAWAGEFRGDLGATGFHEAARLIAAGVASERGVLARALWTELQDEPPPRPTPYAAILRSYAFLVDRDPRAFASALDALKQAVADAPDCGLAWVQLARLATADVTCDVSRGEASLELALRAAHNAARLDPFGRRARAALAHALLVAGDASARAETERALELEPDSFGELEAIAWLLALQGEAERGAALAREAIARNPDHGPVAFQTLWAAHLSAGQLEESLAAAVEHHDRSSFWPGVMRACSLGALGRQREAALEVAELRAARPDFVRRGRGLVGCSVRAPELRERVLHGLGKAGLMLA